MSAAELVEVLRPAAAGKEDAPQSSVVCDEVQPLVLLCFLCCSLPFVLLKCRLYRLDADVIALGVLLLPRTRARAHVWVYAMQQCKAVRV